MKGYLGYRLSIPESWNYHCKEKNRGDKPVLAVHGGGCGEMNKERIKTAKYQ
jgi:hypothetical protein